MISKEPKVECLVVCFGRRGGSIQLTEAILGELLQAQIPIRLALSKEREGKQDFGVNADFEGRFSFSYLIRTLGIGATIEIFRFCNFVLKSNPKNVLWIMPHPLDLIPRMITKSFGIYNVSIIHEIRPHAGSKWPPSWYTKIIIRLSKSVIFLSEYEASKISLANRNTKKFVIRHPILHLSKVASTTVNINHGNYILFIGRIQSYKGLAILADAWRNVFQETDLFLVIAGEGALPNAAKQLPNTQYLNRWLSDGEMRFIIEGATALVFPYLEASQSGLLATDLIVGKRKILTNVPGLLEYATGNTIFVESNNVSALESGIRSLFKSDYLNSQPNNSHQIGTDWIQIFRDKL